MQTDGFFVRGGVEAAIQALTGAIERMGGSIAPGAVGPELAFTVPRGGLVGGYGASYRGAARFVPSEAGRTRVLFEIGPRPWYAVSTVLGTIGIVGLAGIVTQDAGASVTAGIVVVPAAAILLYLYFGQWRRQTAERLEGLVKAGAA